MKEVCNDKWCVYIHTNKHNNKAYIGITSQKPNERWGKNGNEYLRKDNNDLYYHKAFARALKKYKDWNNDWEHIIFAENLSKKVADRMEMMLIALYKTNCCKYNNPSYGYNMTDGGEGSVGRYHTEEAKNKISDGVKEKWKDKAYRTFQTQRLKGEGNPMFGKHHSEETKEILRIAATGKRPSEEIRKKMSDKLIQRWKNPDYKKKMKACRKGVTMPKEVGYNISSAKGGKPVIQYSIFGEYIKEYKYITDASNITSINSGSIYNACCKKKFSAGGYIWRFFDEPLTDEEIKDINNRINNVKGVYENKQSNTWRAVLNQKHIGTYKNKYDAIIARLNAELLLYGYDMAPQYYLFEQYGITNQND